MNFEITTTNVRQDFQGTTADNAILVQPSSVPAGSPEVTATVYGKGFNSTAQAYVGPVRLKTTYVDSTQLKIVIPAYMVSVPARFDIFVILNDGTSSRLVTQSYPFVAYLNSPVLTGLTTTGDIVEGNPGTTVTLTGAGFLQGATVQVNGQSDGILTNLISDTEMLVFVPASYLAHGGIYPVTVQNPYPANMASNIQLLTVFYPAPAVEQIVPASTPARLEDGAGYLNLDVLGYGFRRGAVVLLDGTALLTTYCENDAYCLTVHLVARVPPGLLRISGFAQDPVRDDPRVHDGGVRGGVFED